MFVVAVAAEGMAAMGSGTKRRGRALVGALVALGVMTTGCSLIDGAGESASPASSTLPPVAAGIVGTAGDTTSGPCPAHLVIQTDWFPQAEHGGTYQLIGPGGKVDPTGLTYSGPLAARYRGAHGVQDVEIRAGGAAIDDRSVLQAMAADPDIYLGYVNTDDLIATALRGQPAMGVVGTLDINPQMLMWSPARHSISAFEDLRRTEAPVLYFPGSTYMDYLVSEGYVAKDQLDDTYDGNPDRWLESKGDVLQQGFATNEPFFYSQELPGWSRPVEFFLIHWLGYENYPQVLSLPTERLDSQRDCLELLVPVMQQATVDFFADPDPALQAIVDANTAYDTFWTVTPALNQAAVKTMRQYDIASNGSDDIYGNFDDERVSRLIDIVTEVIEDRDPSVTGTIAVSDVVTNEFIDPTISLAPLPAPGAAALGS